MEICHSLILFPELSVDLDVLASIQPWKEIIDAKGMQIVGHAESLLLKAPCEWEECILGNFFADALVYHYKTSLCGKQNNPCTEPIIGLVNSGSLRANINAGRQFHTNLIFDNAAVSLKFNLVFIF